MHKTLIRVGIGLFLFLLVLVAALFFLSQKAIPEHILYGISFNVPYARELKLDPLTVLDSFIKDLGIRHFRLAAHWPIIEPSKGIFDFTLMDAQMKRVERAHGTVILGVGRRLPRWPECHVPTWAQSLTWDQEKNELRTYIEMVVTRYKDSPALTYWQVENEPYLSIFAPQYCGSLDRAFLKEEVALVHTLDPTHPILVTDSGNLGTWNGAYSLGDAFGTSVYVYFWNPDIGQFKTILPPWFYRAKEGLMALFHGKKATMLIELSLEPWLVEPIEDVPISVQYERMNPQIFNEIINYAKGTRYDTQYLWGGEWWYWLRQNGDDAMWNRAKQLFTTGT